MVLIFYGVYFGVMGRDCAELCVDYMSAGMTVREGGRDGGMEGLREEEGGRGREEEWRKKFVGTEGWKATSVIVVL